MGQTKKYHFSRFYKGIAFAGIVLFFGIIVIWFIPTEDQFNYRGFSISLIICVPLIACSIKLLRMVDDEVVVDGKGIRFTPKKGSTVYLPWEHISKVIAKDFRRQLELYDAQGNKKITIEYHLEDFPELRDLIFKNTTHLQQRDLVGDKIFHRGYISYGAIIGFSLFFIWLALFPLQVYVSSWRFLSLLCLLFPLYLIFFKVNKLQINKDHIILYYNFRQKQIPFSEVTKVYMKNTSDRYGNIHAAVIIEYGENKKVYIEQFREGSFSVYSYLDSTWNSMKKNAI